MSKQTGRVKWFNNAKGFGFIEQVGSDDVFVYYQDIEMDGYKKLQDNQLVEFDVESTQRGLKATNVKVNVNKVSIGFI